MINFAQLAGKHIDAVITSTSSALPLVRAGKVRPLMVFAESKDDVFPDAPLAKELGYEVQSLSSYRAFLGPPNLPPHIAKVLEDAMVKAAQEPEFQKKMKDRGMSVRIIDHEKLLQLTKQQFVAIEKYISRIQAGKGAIK